MKDFLKQNGILILIIALLLSLITAVFSLTFGGLANPFVNLAGIVATPFRNGIHAFVTWTEGVYSDAFEREILAEELALRDLDAERATAENYDEVMDRMEQYMGEFEAHGTDHISVDLE